MRPVESIPEVVLLFDLLDKARREAVMDVARMREIEKARRWLTERDEDDKVAREP